MEGIKNNEISENVEEVVIRTNDWEQQKKNLRTALCYKLVYDSGQNIVPIINGDTIRFPGFVGDVSQVVNNTTFNDAYSTFISEQDIITNANQVEQEKRKTELRINPLNGIKIDDAEAYIDNITDLSSAKTVLKKLIRYLVAKNLM